jgi:hypothetical protein
VLIVLDKDDVTVAGRRNTGDARNRDPIIADDLCADLSRNLSNARHGTCFIRLWREREGGQRLAQSGSAKTVGTSGAGGMVCFGRARHLAVPFSQDEGSAARLEAVPSRPDSVYRGLAGHVLPHLAPTPPTDLKWTRGTQSLLGRVYHSRSARRLRLAALVGPGRYDPYWRRELVGGVSK